MRFQQFATRAKVDHPSGPSLTPEKRCAENLAAKDQETLDSVEFWMNKKDEASRAANLDQDSRAAIEDLVAVAKRFDSE